MVSLSQLYRQKTTAQAQLDTNIADLLHQCINAFESLLGGLNDKSDSVWSQYKSGFETAFSQNIHGGRLHSIEMDHDNQIKGDTLEGRFTMRNISAIGNHQIPFTVVAKSDQYGTRCYICSDKLLRDLDITDYPARMIAVDYLIAEARERVPADVFDPILDSLTLKKGLA